MMLTPIAAGMRLAIRWRPISASALLILFGGIAQGEPDTSATRADTSLRARLAPNARVESRIGRLLERMSLEEKIGQLQQLNSAGGDVTGTATNLEERDALDRRIRLGLVGSILNEVDPGTIRRLQKLAVQESPQHIPLIFGRDVIHGFRTIFPIPLGQAASWNPALVEEAAAIAAREARSVGLHWTFAPMIDIARDPRWGRIAESCGEDAYLASAFAAAMVRGFQGDALSSPDRLAACAKHFAGYGAAEGGRDYNSAQISRSLLRNVYLPPFRSAVDAGVATVMTAFNDVNGIPASANRHLVRQVLRNEWGFRGFVVSDWESIEEMIAHGYSLDEKDAARAAARAGVNMEMVSQTYDKHLAELIEEGAVPKTLIDQLVGDVLRIKIRLGLFENPYGNGSQSPQLAPGHLEVARRLARQSIVMLKNEKGLLPLNRSKIAKVAVIGPLADAKRAQLGTWIPDGRESDSITPLAAIGDSAGKDLEIVYAAGLANDLDRAESGIGQAVAAARQADVVLLFVGEGAEISGEARSRAILDLPGAQNQLVDAVVDAGKPVVLVVQAGRPLTIGRQIERVQSVLYSFHAGTMAGPAIADLVWGKESPSGKLPVTFPKTVGQIPLYYNHASTGRPPRRYDFPKDRQVDDVIDVDLGYNSNYIDVSPYPLYPFGYGLSYASFEYGAVELSKARIRRGEIVVVRAPLTNTGDVAADEVVQLYVRDVAASLVRPVRELRGFRRVRLEPGETKVIEFSLGADDLAYWDNEERRILEPGKFEIYVGGSSLAPLSGAFELVE
jgi:beta-glucosidase